MPSNSYPLIAREGWLFIGILTLLLVGAYYYLGTTFTVITAVILVITLYLLRDPEQTVTSSPLAVVSPVFGKIISVNAVEDPWVTRRALQIKIKMSLLDIYSIRSPVEGKIVNQWTRRPEGENNGRRFAFRVRSDEGDEIVVVINLNFLTAFFFRFYVHSGERLGHGQRCGYLYFGGCIEILVPENSKIRVHPGEHINSGSGILAHLVHTDAATAIHPEPEPAKQE